MAKKRLPMADGAAGRLRRIVHPRDRWCCVQCGLEFPVPPGFFEGPNSKVPCPRLVLPSGKCRELHLDHVVPYVAGGLDEVENLRSLCSSCNSAKGASTAFAGWPQRIARARTILEDGPATQSTAQAALDALRGTV